MLLSPCMIIWSTLLTFLDNEIRGGLFQRLWGSVSFSSNTLKDQIRLNRSIILSFLTSRLWIDFSYELEDS